ncbi:E3 ubiquitin-protein ligase PRT6 isoform X2 [Physcomitrium patens]|uniref:E3 ubiquitin-protein ligase n=1 Tax=Physcomitrium patens TaxID=3218 RepID=A0A2K1K213_PHYPA|nr:E3 ubiquitin-protein ligase PRT6-like isoform X2 [Physcomitrium patens]PNR47818.1 hypothetical protein PHYPA_012291 [Physcomitrium patens]|eukprot:XP_024384261.1 E3 ubiquitin-protein ligase PRT6-like isoform X2 [Physcomitrella patens]
MSLLEPTSCDMKDAEELLHAVTLRMSGGDPLDSYLDYFKAQGQSQCTNVWSKGIIAYRCRTCQTNDSSAICVVCFKKGNHWDHDYVMYHSESGGCCDCGDRAAWKESGFCSAHQRVQVLESKVKDELLEPTHFAVQHVLRELLAWVKKLLDKLLDDLNAEKTDLEVSMVMLYLEWSQKICAVDALRSIVCYDIVHYKILHQTDASTSPLEFLLDCLGWMPEKLIEAETTLYLQLLYKNEFKDQFLSILRVKYENMIFLAMGNSQYMKNYTHLDTNLDRVMVQLFNDPVFTTELIHKYSLLELFIGVFRRVVDCAAENPIDNIVDHDAIKCKVYLRPQGDLRLIVSHDDIAVHILTNEPELFPHFLGLLVKLQWMNSYDLSYDYDFDNSWTLAIQLEMNSMAIIFQLISRCYQSPLVREEALITAATYTFKALKQYLAQAMNTSKSVSLHIPLHRALSAILQKLVLLPWGNYERGFLTALKEKGAFNFSEDEVLALMDHPLAISVWMAQIRAQMWRRASEEFSRLELIYRGSFWHDQSMDMDILLLQFCTVACENLQGTIFIRIAERFNFKDMTTSRTIPKLPIRYITLLQDFMRLILLIVRERRNLGRTEEDEAQDKCLQYDVIQWLCVRDQTYSQLCRALSAIPMNHQKLNAMLEKVAVYHEPKVADRGYYQLKPEYWEEFDPLFPHYYLNELEEAEDRAVKVGKLDHYWRIKAPSAAGAPYDRLSGLLHTKACHLFLLNVLDEVRKLVGKDDTATAGEALGVTALQMMAVLVSDSCNKFRDADAKVQFQEPFDEYSTDDIFINIYVRIRIQGGPHLSIFQMLQEIVQANQCTRLVDSVRHVLELLCSSTNEKTHAAEVDSKGAEDMQRRLRKEQRQKAILDEFAAKRKAFMELQDDCDDDEEFEDGSEMDVSNTVDEASSCKTGTVSSSGALAKSVVPIAETEFLSMETSSEAKECVLCKRKKDDKNSSPCWIALVQRYNFPCQVLKRAEKVTNTGENTLVNDGSSHGLGLNGGLDQLITVGYSIESGNATSIDLSTVDHVQCCGHQMHYDCFKGHMKTLQMSYHPGNGVADPSISEFSCPTCRRLANILLPDVDASISSKRIDLHDDVKGVAETRQEWSGFWQANNNLKSAMECFCHQMLKVRKQSPNLHLNISSEFTISQALWEELALNVVHCEVETRDGFTMAESSSSSSAPSKRSEECIWGGDSAHWVALRDLGKLAILSNTLPDAVQDKGQWFNMLRRSLGLVGRRDKLSVADTATEPSPVLDGMDELERTIREIFPQNPLDFVETSELPESVDISIDSFHCQNETAGIQEDSGSSPLSCHLDMQEESEEVLIHTNTTQSELYEDNKYSSFVELNHGYTYSSRPAAPDPIAPDPQQKHVISFEDAKFEYEMREGNTIGNYSSCRSLPEREESILPEPQDTWMQDILKNGIFTTDPFRLLIVLLIISKGQPSRRTLLFMVKFAYTLAVLQTQIAVTRLDCEGSDVKSLVQRACLPFLRRAAILVQLATREYFRGQHGLSGTKAMDFLSLQLELQLPDCDLILQPYGATEALTTQLLSLYRRNRSTFELRKVPRKTLLHKLPRVFQELLLENIHNKKKCAACGEMPTDPAICLICGMLLCCGSDCCRKNGIGECSRHAAAESAGVGIFLLLRSTQLLLLRNNRTCMGLSLYLDVHGEEDLYLRRSQLLYLSDLRLNEVRRLWMTAAFDYDSYILRNSQSRPKVY